MNDVPLIQNADVNSINTSIIAIKKQLNQISELLGLIDIPDAPDLSPFVRKDEVADVIEADNLNPVTSGAVYSALDGKTIKHKTVTGTTNGNGVLYKTIATGLTGEEKIVNAYVSNYSNYFCLIGWSNNIASDGKIVGQELMVINYDYTKIANTYVEIEIIYF